MRFVLPTVAGGYQIRNQRMNPKETELADKILDEALAATDTATRNDLLHQYDLLLRAACGRKVAENR